MHHMWQPSYPPEETMLIILIRFSKLSRLYQNLKKLSESRCLLIYFGSVHFAKSARFKRQKIALPVPCSHKEICFSSATSRKPETSQLPNIYSKTDLGRGFPHEMAEKPPFPTLIRKTSTLYQNIFPPR